jgi:hypothetical protein
LGPGLRVDVKDLYARGRQRQAGRGRDKRQRQGTAR